MYPVETVYRAPRDGTRLEHAVAAAVADVLRRHDGDVLAFLPGAGEIHRAAAALAERDLGPGVRVRPLHGTLAQEEQDAAIAPSPPGERKVVLATSIAETSLTIDGVRVVVDGGWARVPRFSPRTGMTTLQTVRVSRASADQRRGRAGRVAPGICVRLWEEHETHGLLAQQPPEILDADLASLALELAEAGVGEVTTLRWLDAPPAAALAQARELLRELGALDAAGRITAHGKRMNRLGAHPRLAHLLLEGERLGHAALAADLAALLEERDLLRAPEGPVVEADVRLRLEALRDPAAAAAHGLRVDQGAAARVRQAARHWRQRLRVSADARADADAAGLLLAFAYPDRLARRRADAGRYVLRGGGGAVLAGAQALTDAEWLVVAESDGRRPEARVFRAAAVTQVEIERHFAEQIEREDVVAWDDAAQAVTARRRERLGAIVLRDAPLRDPDPALVSAALLDAVRRRGVAALPWSDATRRTRERLAFLHRLDPTHWPDVSDDALQHTLDAWLAPHLVGVRRMDEVGALDLGALLLEQLPWARRQELDRRAPTHVVVPTGSRLPVDYADPAAPVLAVRLQEMFGLAETPAVGDGRVPLTLHLLSPAHRPVQVTRDLAGFWRTSYFDVRKDLRGRYPRHHWPQNPMEAEPTRRAKRRGE
jgi:ATP-dependent helicase HrpB